MMDTAFRITTSAEPSRQNFSAADCSKLLASFSQLEANADISAVNYRSNFESIQLTNGDFVCYNGIYAPVVLNQPAYELAACFHRAQPLLNVVQALDRRGFDTESLVAVLAELISLGLLAPGNQTRYELLESRANLCAWIHVTDNCNLRCNYCYLPHRNVSMTLEVGQAAIDATFRSAKRQNFQHIQLKYAGGEAMLDFALIRDLQQYAMELAARESIVISGVVLSNGTLLTEEIITNMLQLKLQLTISLDGLEMYHNRQRKFAGGKGSYHQVITAIDFAVDKGLLPTIAITVSEQNVEGLPDLTTWLLERDLPFKLSLYRENIRSKPYPELRLDEEHIIAGMRKVFRVIEANLPRRCLLDALVDRADLSGPQLRSCGAGQNYLVFDHKGQVSKCQMQMDLPVSNSEAPDPLAMVQAASMGVKNPTVDERSDCRSCEWKYWCGGGCSFLTFQTTGRHDVKSPNCHIYKALYPEVVHLEGLRLQKYGQESVYLPTPYLQTS